jgi:hypothetical protein
VVVLLMAVAEKQGLSESRIMKSFFVVVDGRVSGHPLF